MEKYYGIPLAETHFMKHYQFSNVPKNCIQDTNLNIELPYPVFQCYNQVIDLEEYRQPFCSNSAMDNRFQYYKKTHATKDVSVMKKYIKRVDVNKLPFYFVDVASGLFDNCGDDVFCYTGGILDCLSFNDRTCLVWSALKQPLHIVDVNDSNINCNVSLTDGGAIYNIKSMTLNHKMFVGVRQKYKVSLFQVLLNDTISCTREWEANSVVPFYDMTLNEFNKAEITTIDHNYKLRVTDFYKNNIKLEIDMCESANVVNDNFAKIEYIDKNTLCCMNRCCLHFVDIRSSSVQKHCLKLKKMNCDELCTFSTLSNFNNLSVVSKHNYARFDLRSMSCIDRISHLMENSPFISRSISEGDTEYVCLMGENYKDKMMFHNTRTDLNTPRYIPSMIDSYKFASLTSNVKHSEYIEGRILLPCVGMQLHRDAISNEIILYTANSVGDVFRQNILERQSANNQTLSTLSCWIESFPKKPINFKTNNVFDLSHYVTISGAKRKKFEFMTTDYSATFYNEEHSNLVEYLESNTGLSMDSIWNLKTEVQSDCSDL